uniref:Protein phosphatase 2clike [Tribolium castaneum] n=1 Tax=Lepeophtheirus salmonis TaxID=72036 RepID=A0A0K2T9K8_LEPSM
MNSDAEDGSRSIGVNLRVTGHFNQGGRKYMEDFFSVAYQQTVDEKDLEYAYFGIFDGHGGEDAALFAKEHLMDYITKQKNFWSEDDQAVLKAIREGFLHSQRAMWADLNNWKKTSKGHPSTAGTTASVAFIKRGKIFTGHVGDSRIILGQKDSHDPNRWKAKALTRDHKPESPAELQRIERHGGKVVNKSGVPRVVWKRPKIAQQGPLRRSTPTDEVPFLAVARALGDLWSYNPEDDVFIVSPEPDLDVYSIDILKDKCLILATDGAWNVLNSHLAVQMANHVEKNNEEYMMDPDSGYRWINPSKHLVDNALHKWKLLKMRSDNISVLTVMLDPPGPPRAQVLRNNMCVNKKSSATLISSPPPKLPPKPMSKELNSNKNLAIISRCPNSPDNLSKIGTNLAGESGNNLCDSRSVTRVVHDSIIDIPRKMFVDRNAVYTHHAKFGQMNDSDRKSPSPPPIPERPLGLRKSKLSRIVDPAIANRRRSIGYNNSEENKLGVRSLRGRKSCSNVIPSPMRVLRPKNTTPSSSQKRKTPRASAVSASKVLKTSDQRIKTLTWGPSSASKLIRK